MATTDARLTDGRTVLSFADEHDIDEFVATLDSFERGEITPDQWRAFRLVRGTYGQRQTDDANMLRVKIPQGRLTASQLEAMGEVAERYARGFGHLTTRQNIQYHFLKLHDMEPIMRRLAEEGLTTREACGNSVRNVTTCPYAGVSADEPFDVTPYAEALTRYFLRHPLAASLPRKFKIGFEGCTEDHAYAAINDIGWFARVRDRDGRTERGFKVTVGGGTATMTRSGFVLFEFLPAAEMLEVAEAIVRVFHRFGDYKHKHRNRMKFLIKQLGWEKWQEEFHRLHAEFRAEGAAPLPFDAERAPEDGAPDWPRPAAPSPEATAALIEAERLHGPGIHPTLAPVLRVTTPAFAEWQRTNVRRQRQPGYVTAVVTLPLGDFSAGQMRVLADLARAYGDGTVRVTVDQNLIFRWIRVTDVEALYSRLAAAGLGQGGADTAADVVSCPGAESCKLAVTQSRGLGRLLADTLRARPDLTEAAPGLHIKMSGCPNGCGQHHIAGIGFQGSIRKIDGRAVPQYFVMVGGDVSHEGASFGRVAAKVPARRIPEVVERLIRVYRTERHEDESAQAFFRRVDPTLVKVALADLERLTAETATPEDFIDLGETTAFAPEVMDGECSA